MEIKKIKKQIEKNDMNNYIIAGTGSGFASPDIEDENNSEENEKNQNNYNKIKSLSNGKYPNGMIYKKNNVSYTKSNVTDLSMDNFNQQKKR